MRAFVLIIVIATFSGVVAAMIYGATQVSPGTWDYAVIALVTPIGVGAGVAIGASGVAKVRAAKHPPADKHVTVIDKAVFTDSARQIDKPW